MRVSSHTRIPLAFSLDAMAGDEGALGDIAQDVLAKIQRRNKLSLGFKEVIEDYQRVLRQAKEQAVRSSVIEASSCREGAREFCITCPWLHLREERKERKKIPEHTILSRSRRTGLEDWQHKAGSPCP